MSKYNYYQGDVVNFDYQGVVGHGVVSGCSMNELPVVGRHYIIKVIHADGIDEEEYPFECVSIPECSFRLRN